MLTTKSLLVFHLATKILELNYDKINDWVCVAHQVVGMYFRIIPPDCFG